MTKAALEGPAAPTPAVAAVQEKAKSTSKEKVLKRPDLAEAMAKYPRGICDTAGCQLFGKYTPNTDKHAEQNHADLPSKFLPVGGKKAAKKAEKKAS